MKLFPFILLGALCTFTVTSRGEIPERSVQPLLQSIRAGLPKGWTARYGKETSWLAISRDQPIAIDSTSPNSPPPTLPNDHEIEIPRLREYCFAFRLRPLVPLVEHLRLSAENARIKKEACALYEKLVAMNTIRKFDSFSSRTNEQQTAVARYEALQKSWQILPVFYFRDIGLWWGFNSPDNLIMIPADERIRAECIQVREKITALLSKYPSL